MICSQPSTFPLTLKHQRSCIGVKGQRFAWKPLVTDATMGRSSRGKVNSDLRDLWPVWTIFFSLYWSGRFFRFGVRVWPSSCGAFLTWSPFHDWLLCSNRRGYMNSRMIRFILSGQPCVSGSTSMPRIAAQHPQRAEEFVWRFKVRLISGLDSMSLLFLN